MDDLEQNFSNPHRCFKSIGNKPQQMTNKVEPGAWLLGRTVSAIQCYAEDNRKAVLLRMPLCALHDLLTAWYPCYTSFYNRKRII